jgi:hypothetical protein
MEYASAENQSKPAPLNDAAQSVPCTLCGLLMLSGVMMVPKWTCYAYVIHCKQFVLATAGMSRLHKHGFCMQCHALTVSP